MNNNLLLNFLDVVVIKLNSGQVTVFNDQEIRNTLQEIANDNIAYYYDLTTQLNHYLQKINFNNDFLCRVSEILTEITDQYEYEKLSESDKKICSIRKDLTQAINLLDELYNNEMEKSKR